MTTTPFFFSSVVTGATKGSLVGLGGNWQPHQRKSVLSSPVTRSYSQGGPGIESIAVDGEVKLNMVGASSLRGHLSANYLTQCLRSLDLDAKMGGGLVVS